MIPLPLVVAIRIHTIEPLIRAINDGTLSATACPPSTRATLGIIHLVVLVTRKLKRKVKVKPKVGRMKGPNTVTSAAMYSGGDSRPMNTTLVVGVERKFLVEKQVCASLSLRRALSIILTLL